MSNIVVYNDYREYKLGKAMWDFERRQILAGRREPFPCTPVIGKVSNVSEARREIRDKLLPIYRDITWELMDMCLPHRATDRLPDLFMRAWEQVKEEEIGDAHTSSM